MVEAETAGIHDGHHVGGKVCGESRTAESIIDHSELILFTAQLDHGVDEFLVDLPSPYHPTGSKDEIAIKRPFNDAFPGMFRSAVHIDRIRGVVFVVWLAFLAVKDIGRTDIDHHRALFTTSPDDVFRAEGIARISVIGFLFAEIHIGFRRQMQNQIRLVLAECRAHRSPVLDVHRQFSLAPHRSTRRHDLTLVGTQRIDHRRSQHASRSCHEHFHLFASVE